MKELPLRVLINPLITPVDNTQVASQSTFCCQQNLFHDGLFSCPQVTMRESCCSMHGFSGPVTRAQAVHVKGRNEVRRKFSNVLIGKTTLPGGGGSKLEEQWLGGKDPTA